MTGHDRQWLLNRRNFEGRWCGTSCWFERQPAGLNLEQPTEAIPGTCYAISFSDDDTGLWDGSGLRLAPGGCRRLPLSRASYNAGGQCWQFPGVAGQSSLQVDPLQRRFGHELNFFHARSRSMLVLLYEPLLPAPAVAGASGPAASLGWQLQSLAVVPFRCSLSPRPDPARPTAGDWQTLLAEQEGWPGQLERLEPHHSPASDPDPLPTAPFRSAAFCAGSLTAGFADGLVCSLPEQLPAGAFALQVGCRLAADRFNQVTLTYNSRQQLMAWELRRFQRPAGVS